MIPVSKLESDILQAEGALYHIKIPDDSSIISCALPYILPLYFKSISLLNKY
jgi:hypothetical protein